MYHDYGTEHKLSCDHDYGTEHKLSCYHGYGAEHIGLPIKYLYVSIQGRNYCILPLLQGIHNIPVDIILMSNHFSW